MNSIHCNSVRYADWPPEEIGVPRFAWNDFQIKMSKLGEQDKMLKISDCKLPNPQRWPGKFSKDNTMGH